MAWWQGILGGMGMGMSTTTTEDTKIGTIVVDIFDTKSKQLLWRGKESNDLSNNPEKNAKNLPKEMADLFNAFLHHTEEGYRLPSSMRLEGG